MSAKSLTVQLGSLILLVCAYTFAWAGEINTETMLPETVVDPEGDKNVFATGFDYRDGMLFTVHVEPASASGNPGVNLITVVRKGVRQPDGVWHWEKKIIEDHTILDPWHTQASIALDKQGYIHVAYNMHNMPWQYSVSEKPYDISNFKFRGQSVTLGEIETVKFQNKTSFPQIGSAAIPGNQVTYPMFFSDRHGDIYLTYRFALKPARHWGKRAFAGAIAKYDVVTQRWWPLGGAFPISTADAVLFGGSQQATQTPFAFEDTYSVYLPTLAFDANNGMHIFLNWRPGGAGMDTINPSYAFSPDGERFFKSDGQAYKMPISLAQSDVIVRPYEKFYAPKSVTVLANGSPAVVIQPLSGGRQLVTLDSINKHWNAPEAMPAAASEIVVDSQGSVWAFATGLRVFMRSANKVEWQEIGQISTGLCFPKVKYYPTESRFVIHAKTCDGQRATIISFRQ